MTYPFFLSDLKLSKYKKTTKNQKKRLKLTLNLKTGESYVF